MTRRTSKRISSSVIAATLGLAVSFFAEGDAGAQQKGVITIREVTIVGRVQKPVASVDVNKIQAKLTLAELKKPFLERISAAVEHEPF
ncbi:MAG: hypothetical protein U0169_13925 [Polyangiaceae bacterium]